MTLDGDRDAQALQRLENLAARHERRAVGHHELEHDGRIEREARGRGVAHEDTAVRHLLDLGFELRPGRVQQPKAHSPS